VDEVCYLRLLWFLINPVTQADTVLTAKLFGLLDVFLQQEPISTVGVGGGGALLLDVDQMAKLRSELDIVQQNCHVFSEMLTEQTPGQEQTDDWALMQVSHSSYY